VKQQLDLLLEQVHLQQVLDLMSVQAQKRLGPEHLIAVAAPRLQRQLLANIHSVSNRQKTPTMRNRRNFYQLNTPDTTHLRANR
jgi:hypothetical protein